MGLPLERTTIVGTPVSRMAWMRGPWAPTRARESRSTCSPVLNGEDWGLVVGGGMGGIRIGGDGRNVRGVVVLPQFGLVARPGAHDDDGYVRLLGCCDGFVEARLVVAPAFAALRVVNGSGVADGGFDAIEGSDAAPLAAVDHVVAVLMLLA